MARVCPLVSSATRSQRGSFTRSRGTFESMPAMLGCERESITPAIKHRMPLQRETVDSSKLNQAAHLPFQLRLADFEIAMQDVYDFFHDVNTLLLDRGLHRLDDMLRPAAMSGMVSDMLTASMAKHARSLVENKHFNGHPDLIVQGRYKNNAIASGKDGVEIKSTRKKGGAVDTHGAREQYMCVFVYETDHVTEPAIDRKPMKFTEVYLAHVVEADFRKNSRSALGTRTATLDAKGVQKLRANWIYLIDPK